LQSKPTNCVGSERARDPSTPLSFLNATATTAIYTLSLHDALPICAADRQRGVVLADDRRAFGRAQDRLVLGQAGGNAPRAGYRRSEEHTSELQSLAYLVCRLLLEKKKQHAATRLRHVGLDQVVRQH